MSDSKTIPQKVTVSPLAFSYMALHALEHPHETVHGLLLGEYNTTEETVVATNAVPVCHGAPTKPLVETAIGLIDSDTEKIIVGWYTAPALLHDTKPSAVALRMAANLDGTASESKNPSCLIVIQNSALMACINGESKTPGDMIQCLGKDFGSQWLDPLPSIIENAPQVLSIVKKARESKIVVSDLIDHFENDTVWYPNDEVSRLVR